MNASQARDITNRGPYKTFVDSFIDLIYDKILREARKGENFTIISTFDMTPETINEIETRLLADGYDVKIPQHIYIKW